MRGEFLPFAAPLLGDEEIQEVVHCLRSGWLTTGHKVKQFEREFGEFIGAKHALAVNSCTAALHLALEAVGVGPGDEVITTPMTFTATAAVIEHLGARPVFADVTAQTLNIDPEQIRRRLSPRTKAILPVHFAGQACDMDAIVDIARGAGVPVIEDAAHAIPTRYNGRMVGTLSDITCFSFYATKNVTTGEGGMVVTDRDDIMERMRLMHLHGMSKDAWKRYTQNGSWSYEILAPGFKYNLTDIAAAIGIHQLRKCQAFHRRRLTIADQYDAADKTATAAVQHARRTNDVALVARVDRRRERVGQRQHLGHRVDDDDVERTGAAGRGEQRHSLAPVERPGALEELGRFAQPRRECRIA